MIHYTCDRCKRVLDPAEDLRYVVKMEVNAVMEPVDAEQNDDDRDHLLEVHEILERADDEEDPCVSDHVFRRRRYDLCPECHQKFMKNPLGREQHAAQLGFSQN